MILRGLHTSLLILLLFGCGGGGGSSGSAPPAGGNTGGGSTGGGSTLLQPTWTLQRAQAAELGQTQAEVDAILNHVFQDQAVQSAMLVLDGYIIGERYGANRNADSLGTSWSVAKSFYSAAIGVAIAEGWIQGLDQPASDFLTEWLGTAKEPITIGQLLQMRGGFAADTSIFFSDDHTAFALDFPLTRTPGTSFTYSNPTSQLFEPLLLRATGLDAHTYLRQTVLTPIGIDTNTVGMWFDRTGANPLTYMGLDMTPAQMARFGLLYARDGEWDGQQVLPADYVQASLTAQSPSYGYQWWVLNQAYFGAPVPIEVVAAWGLDGQKIYVWPATDVVLVVQTRYEHAANQGYVLSDLNYPDTCTARNSCPDAVGDEVATYNEHSLILLLEALQDP
ncbi:MAG: serine hydrolase [Pseudomonadales bacterium]